MSSVLPPEEDIVLQRYREQGSEQPSAVLDARILAAARQATASRRPSSGPTGWLARIGHWLSDASLARRGALAFGSLASVALALGLVWQGLPERHAQESSAMAPAPAAVQAEPPAFERQLARPAPVTQSAAAAAAAARPAPPEQAKRLAAAPAQARTPMTASEAAAATLDSALLEILRLRGEGRAGEAQQRLDGLRQRYSEILLQQRLVELGSTPQEQP